MTPESNVKSPLILVIESNSILRDDLSFSLSSRFAARVEAKGSVREGIDWIKLQTEYVHLILIEDCSELSSFLKYLAKNRIRTPCLLTTDNPEHDLEAHLSPNLSDFILRDRLVEELYKKAPPLLEGLRTSYSEEYCPIPTHLLERLSPIQGDVFIRLSANKHIRLFAENDYCSREDIEKYAVKKNVPYLYLKRDDMDRFMIAINEHLKRVLESIRLQKLSIEEMDEIASEAIDTVQGYVLRFGFTDEARTAAERAIEITEQTVSENSKLSQIFHRFSEHNNRYSPVHSLVIAHVASAICSELQWNTKGTLYKLILAAIFHDISIPNDNLAGISSLEELEARSGEFTDKEREDYKQHPFIAMQVAEKFKQIPTDVTQILLQHHERPDGSGFPRGLSSGNISPLSAVFIVAHELVRKLLINKERFTLEEEFLLLVKQFDHGSTFHSILAVIDPYNRKVKMKLYG